MKILKEQMISSVTLKYWYISKVHGGIVYDASMKTLRNKIYVLSYKSVHASLWYPAQFSRDLKDKK